MKSSRLGSMIVCSFAGRCATMLLNKPKRTASYVQSLRAQRSSAVMGKVQDGVSRDSTRDEILSAFIEGHTSSHVNMLPPEWTATKDLTGFNCVPVPELCASFGEKIKKSAKVTPETRPEYKMDGLIVRKVVRIENAPLFEEYLRALEDPQKTAIHPGSSDLRSMHQLGYQRNPISPIFLCGTRIPTSFSFGMVPHPPYRLTAYRHQHGRIWHVMGLMNALAAIQTEGYTAKGSTLPMHRQSHTNTHDARMLTGTTACYPAVQRWVIPALQKCL